MPFAAFEDAVVKEKEKKSSRRMQQVFLPPSLLFIQDFVLMFFMCVYITDISDYLVVIMLLCHYVASVDQALRTFQVSQQGR